MSDVPAPASDDHDSDALARHARLTLDLVIAPECLDGVRANLALLDGHRRRIESAASAGRA